MLEIRRHITEGKIWIPIDKTIYLIDVERKYIANVIVETLLADGLGKVFI